MKDLWEMFINEFQFYFPNQKLYFFCDKKNELLSKYNLILYKRTDDFTSQYLKSLKKVKEEYVITLNEDYILYDFVKIKKLQNYINVLKKNNKISFIRFHKGPNSTKKKFASNLYYLDNSKRHLYSQTATMWRRSDLISLYKAAPKSFIGQNLNNVKNYLSTEDEIDKISIKKKIIGLYAYHDEKLVGHSNYDSFVFPYLQSIVVKGEWNFKEYKNNLKFLFQKYNIDFKKRSIFRNNFKDEAVSFLKKIGLKNEY